MCVHFMMGGQASPILIIPAQFWHNEAASIRRCLRWHRGERLLQFAVGRKVMGFGSWVIGHFHLLPEQFGQIEWNWFLRFLQSVATDRALADASWLWWQSHSIREAKRFLVFCLGYYQARFGALGPPHLWREVNWDLLWFLDINI